MSELMQITRQIWFNNEGYEFEFTVRQDIFWYGGPAPEFNDCEECQNTEWNSRGYQRPFYGSFSSHSCPTVNKCREMCEKQGDDRWANYHQDHWFAVGCDPELNAPKGAFLMHDIPPQYEWYWSRNCNASMATFRQKLAYTCQVDPEVRFTEKDWSKYDFAFFVNKGEIPLFDRPPIPLVLYCHDMWRGNKQEVLDHFKPEVILTPFATPWRENFNIPPECELVFAPAVVSPFFDRPNLGPDGKDCDLLVIGALGSDFYEPRRELNEQIARLPARYTVQHSHETGAKRARWFGPLDDEHPYMNKWSELLASARYVIFGPCAGKAREMLLIKYFECMSSGAIPIMPQVKDLDALGIHPMVHYIPFDVVRDNNPALVFFLGRWQQYRYIAENALEWHRENAHRLCFELFEDVIHKAIKKKYPKRVL